MNRQPAEFGAAVQPELRAMQFGDPLDNGQAQAAAAVVTHAASDIGSFIRAQPRRNEKLMNSQAYFLQQAADRQRQIDTINKQD